LKIKQFEDLKIMVQRITVLLLRCMAAATRLTATVHAPLTLGMFPFRGLTPPATNMQPLRGWVLGEKFFAAPLG